MPKILDQEAVRQLLKAETVKAGTPEIWAVQKGMTGGYVRDVQAGNRAPGPKVLRALGLEKIVTYRKAEGV